MRGSSSSGFSIEMWPREKLILCILLMLGCDALTHTSSWLPTDVHYATDLDFNGPVVDYFEDAPESGWSIGFEPAAYDAMTRDENRTPLYERAIRDRLRGARGAVVLDLGTGPFALLARFAAKYGAARVYAVEGDAAAAARARETVRREERAGRLRENQIVVLEGYSTAVSLPEPASRGRDYFRESSTGETMVTW